MSDHSKELVVEWTFAGGWLILLGILALVAYRTATRPQATYRAFVPFIGLVTALLLAGSIVIGGHYFPAE